MLLHVWVVAFVVIFSLSGCTTAWIDAIVAQHRHAEAQRPDAPREDRSSFAPPATHRRLVRIWADSDYRASAVDWRAAVGAQLDRVTSSMRPYDLELVVSEMREWDRRSASGLATDLEALVRNDEGAGVDVVVGLVSASPVVTSSVHHLGYAQVLGKHIVMRGMDSAAERDALLGSYSMVSREKLEEIYRDRLRHKQTAVMIHELGHLLGAVHGVASDDYMHPSYSPHQNAFSADNEELVRASITAEDHKRAPRAVLAKLEERAKRRPLLPDEEELATALRRYASANQSTPVALAPKQDETELQPLQLISTEQSDTCHIKSLRRIKLLTDSATVSELQPVATRIGADSVAVDRKQDHAMATLLRCR